MSKDEEIKNGLSSRVNRASSQSGQDHIKEIYSTSNKFCSYSSHQAEPSSGQPIINKIAVFGIQIRIGSLFTKMENDTQPALCPVA